MIAKKDWICCPMCDGHGQILVPRPKPKLIDRKFRIKTAKQLRAKGYTIREIAKMMGYNHPGSISDLLK